MKTCNGFWLFVMLLIQGLNARLPEDPVKLGEWEQRTLTRIESLRHAPVEEALPKLAKMYRKYRLPTFSRVSDTQVISTLEAALAERPEFPEFFQGYLLSLREKGRENPGENTHFLSERGMIFAALGELRTPEVVDFFAGFLDDDDRESVGHMEATMAQAAAMQLRGMLEDPPATTVLRMKPWLEWRDRVREGKQTYSFKGSKKRYDFQGEVLATPRTSRRPVEERSERPAVDSGDEPERTPWVPVVGALLALMLGFAFWKWKARPAA